MGASTSSPSALVDDDDYEREVTCCTFSSRRQVPARGCTATLPTSPSTVHHLFFNFLFFSYLFYFILVILI
jgi:hypothetical protein